jgi:hypothetical protein
VEWSYSPGGISEEGNSDLRLLLGDIFQTADQHLKTLAPVSDKALAPATPGAVATRTA